VTARVPEMTAETMPLGTVEPRSPERRGELVVRGSSTHGAMPVGQGDPRFVYQHKDLITPRPAAVGAGQRGLQPERPTRHEHTPVGSHRVANKCVVTKRQGVHKRQEIARECTTRVPRGV
jgi:hypothetical protein